MLEVTGKEHHLESTMLLELRKHEVFKKRQESMLLLKKSFNNKSSIIGINNIASRTALIEVDASRNNFKLDTTVSNPALKSLPKVLSKPHPVKHGSLAFMVQSTTFANNTLK